MSESARPRLMIPFHREIDYAGIDAAQIVYGRGGPDYQSECQLFTSAVENSMTRSDVELLRRMGIEACYVYDMLDLENREFTRDGFLAINSDIHRAIEWGFTHILVSNAYIIELLANEHGDRIRVIISSLLECNSARSRVFFDVLNDTSSISHVILSQNRLTPERFDEMRLAFQGFELVAEVDRWHSDIQMVHEHYYNVVYGYNDRGAVAELARLTSSGRFLRHVSPCKPFLLGRSDLTYKIGEVNATAELILSNIEALCRNCFDRIRIVDLELWQPVAQATRV